MTLYLRVSFILLVFFVTVKANAQVNDDLKNIYFDKIDQNIYTNTDSALFYSEQLLSLGLKHSDSLTIAEGYESVGNCHYYKNNLPKALSYFDNAKQLYSAMGYKDYLGILYMSYGNIYSDLGQFSTSLSFYQRSETLLSKYSNYYDDEALLFYNMAHVFMDINDTTNLKKYINRAKAIINGEDISYLKAALKNVESDLAIRQQKFDLAKKLALEALDDARQQTDLIEQVFSFQNLACIAIKQGHTQKGIHYQDTALSIAKIYGDQFMILAQKTKLAQYHLGAGNILAADTLAKSSYTAGQKLNSLIVTRNTSLVLAEVLEQKGEFESSLELYKIHTAVSDSISGFELSEKVLLSENLLAESKNEILKTEAELLKVSNESNKTLTVAAIAGLCLSVLVIVLLVVLLRLRKKTVNALNAKQRLIDEKSQELELKNSELEKMNNAKDRLFSIITHDLRQPFNQISSFIQILEHTPEIDESLRQLVSEIKESTNHTLSAMNNLLVWSKSQFLNIKTYPEKVEVLSLLNGVLTEMTASINEKKLKIDVDIASELMLFADSNHIEIILRNLLSNAIKFSPVGGTLKVRAQSQDGFVELSISDQGKGMSHHELERLFDAENHFSTPGTLNEKGSGLGMLIVSDFIKENKGTIKVASQLNLGSTFKVILPAA